MNLGIQKIGMKTIQKVWKGKKVETPQNQPGNVRHLPPYGKLVYTT